MKKVLLMMAVVVALSLISCDNSKNYKAKGEELSKQLNEQVEKQDTAAVLASDDLIRKVEQEIIASGDSIGLADFRDAMKDSRVRNAAFVTLSKINNGMDKNEALKELAEDALKRDINLRAVTNTINMMLKVENKAENKE